MIVTYSVFRFRIRGFCKLSTIQFRRASSMSFKTFLFWFSNEQYPFRNAELLSVMSMFKLDSHLASSVSIGPFVLLKLPSENCAKQIMSRSVLAHSCMEVMSQGDSMSSLHETLKNNLHAFEAIKKDSFAIRVETYGKTISMQTKRDFIDTFDYLPMEGPVDLKSPQTRLELILYHGLDPNNVPDEPIHCFFGRWVSDGQRRLMYQISLKDRKFIGNTSMDPLLSLLMANLGLVKTDDFVLDPFVGSGSLLVAAALMGAYVTGTDIDYLMLHGKTRPTRALEKKRAEDENVRSNLRQYGVESKYIDVLVADASRPLWRGGLTFDAIITDPPYGMREPTEKIGTFKSYKIKDEHIAKHIPSKVAYSLKDIYCDLLNFAAERLVLGGRLVFWIPIARDTYDESKLPSNPCFALRFNCEQSLTAIASRRLLVMEKIAEPAEIEYCQTIMDATALMYRQKFFDANPFNPRKERKKASKQNFGPRSKRGQLMVDDEPLANSNIS